jgi:ubiquinone/menaquinone biosynthesis C-methylase UbiE
MHQRLSWFRRVPCVLAWSAIVVVLATTRGWTQTIPRAPEPAIRTDPRINQPFKKPDVKRFIATFESDNREIYTKRMEILSALGLTPGMAVADVGAGTGLFTRLFAEKVGPTGKVYAVEISPEFLSHIAAEARKRGESQVVTVLGSQESTSLPQESVDLVFLCDVYHHLEKPNKTLLSIRRALKPDGRLVVIDFDRVEGRSTGFVLKHVRAGKSVFLKEIESAGFRPIPTRKPPAFKENFYLSFEKRVRSVGSEQ